jgi:hypothetical protein
VEANVDPVEGGLTSAVMVDCPCIVVLSSIAGAVFPDDVPDGSGVVTRDPEGINSVLLDVPSFAGAAGLGFVAVGVV